MAVNYVAVGGRFKGLYTRAQGVGYCFRIQVEDPDSPTGKKRVWIAVPGGWDITKTQAFQYMSTYRGKSNVTAPSNETLIEYWRRWLPTRHIDAGTKKTWIRAVEKRSKELHRNKVSELTTEHFRALIAKWKTEGLTGGTIQTYLVPFSVMYGTLLADGKVPSNPVKALERGSVPRRSRKKKMILEPAILSQLFDTDSLSLKVYNGLGLLAGLRQSESLGLQFEDIYWEGTIERTAPHIHVTRQLTPAGGLKVGLKGKPEDANEKWVELPSILASMLLEQKIATGGQGFVVCTERDSWSAPRDGSPKELRSAGGPQGHRAMRDRFDDLCKAKKLRAGFTYHQLRHNFCTTLIAAGHDVQYIADQMGHANPLVTLGEYSHEFTARKIKGGAAASIDAHFNLALEDES